MSDGGGGGRADSGPVRMRLLVRGQVQGVGFRYFVRGAARELGLVGRVRNLWGGEVEVEVAGEAGRVEALKARLRQGPPGAIVAGLDEEPLDAAPDWERFEIDR